MLPAPEGYWQSLKEGLFYINGMDDDHLARCILMMRKNIKGGHYERRTSKTSLVTAQAKLAELEAELAIRGLGEEYVEEIRQHDLSVPYSKTRCE